MNRRQFLKSSLSAMMVFLLARLIKKLPLEDPANPGRKEALYSRSPDELNG